MNRWKLLITISLGLLLLGVTLTFLMVLKIFPSTLFLNFLSYACTVAGLLLGFFGITEIVRRRK